MRTEASKLIKQCYPFPNIVYSATRLLKCVNFKLPLFPNFPLVDLERLKNDRRWLSDSHVTLGLLLVSSSFLNCSYLKKTAIVFRIASNEIFGVMLKSNCWIQLFGIGCMKIPIYTRVV
jgi:hypothetical protein